MSLQNYEVNFEYIPGKKNTAADALSRNILSQEANSVVCNMQELTTLDTDLVHSEQRKDETWKQIIVHLEGYTQSAALKLSTHI